jgi:aspartyl-tRNA(Asn)/glutamyl-tRNA(Gln) amidotransferase subunit B
VFGLNPDTATTLVSQKVLADYFEAALAEVPSSPQIIANWVVGDLLGALNKMNLSIEESPIPATDLGTLVARIQDHTISSKMAKTIFESMCAGEGKPDDLIAAKGMKQMTDTSAIEKIIDEVMAQFPQQLSEYRSGKDKLFGFFVGQVMKASKGTANPAQLNDLLVKKLS